MPASVRIARVYDERGPGDGTRVLVDRLWPRGVHRDDPRIDRWLPAVAPSTELRKWYGHDPERSDAFAGRYEQELAGGEEHEALEELRAILGDGPLTLLTATKDVDLSHLAVLARVLGEGDGKGKS